MYSVLNNALDLVCVTHICCVAKVVRLHNVPYNTLTGWIANRNITLGSGGHTQLEQWVKKDLAEVLVHLSNGGRKISPHFLKLYLSI